MEQKLWGQCSYLWMGLNAIDAVTTLAAGYTRFTLAIPIGTVAWFSLAYHEGNPFFHWLALSPQAFVLFKALGTMLVLETLFILRWTAVLRLLNSLWCGVIAWNIIWIVVG